MITPVLVGSYWGNIRYLLLQDLVKMLISTMENGYKIIIIIIKSYYSSKISKELVTAISTKPAKKGC